MFTFSLLVSTLACSKRSDPSDAANTGGDSKSDAASLPPAIELTLTYGSEKKAWINDVTAAFNADGSRLLSGKRVTVTALPMGSGELVDEVLTGTRQPDLISPASGVFVKLGNAQSRAKTGNDLLGPTDNLVLSPVVIAMWTPMAEALGYGKKPLGWSDVLDVTRNPEGWTGYGHPEWGKFKLGHTHPDFSNSGLITALAMVYASNGKVAGLTVADANSAQTGNYIHAIESAVQHYGSSTGFFAEKIRSGGPGYLSAAVLYESSVVEANQAGNLVFPLVAIYPKEGTFWSDHPIGVVNRPWVTDERKAAAKMYVDYLLAAPQQQKALTYGFRPADPSVAVTTPITTQFGVDPAEPKTTLEVPSSEVMNAVLGTWHANKKAANVVLVLDTSGSMNEQNKVGNAKAGAQQLIERLDNADTLSLMPFSDQSRWAGQGLAMSSARAQAGTTIQNLIADGGTRLYDSVDVAVSYLKTHPSPDKISAVVVLTDGEDNQSTLKLDSLVAHIKAGSEHDASSGAVRVFTIGYGDGADERVLKRIADETLGKYYKGTPQNIRDVFRDIATFF